MAEVVAWNLGTPEEEEAVAVLVLRYLDGLARREEVTRLNAALRASSACRDFFVRISHLQGSLREALAPLGRHFQSRKRTRRQALAQSDSLRAVPSGAGPGGDSLPEQESEPSARDNGGRSNAKEAPRSGSQAAKDTVLLKMSSEDTIVTKKEDVRRAKDKRER